MPSREEKVILKEAGLGEKRMTYDKYGGYQQMQSSLLKEFLKLSEGGGFQLLRSSGVRRSLDLIPIKIPIELNLGFVSLQKILTIEIPLPRLVLEILSTKKTASVGSLRTYRKSFFFRRDLLLLKLLSPLLKALPTGLIHTG